MEIAILAPFAQDKILDAIFTAGSAVFGMPMDERFNLDPGVFRIAQEIIQRKKALPTTTASHSQGTRQGRYPVYLRSGPYPYFQ